MKLDEQLKSRFLRGRILLNIVPVCAFYDYSFKKYDLEKINDGNGELSSCNMNLSFRNNLYGESLILKIGNISGPIPPGTNECESKYGFSIFRILDFNDNIVRNVYSNKVKFSGSNDLNFILNKLRDEIKEPVKIERINSISFNL